jgi:hypothetical protein
MKILVFLIGLSALVFSGCKSKQNDNDVIKQRRDSLHSALIEAYLAASFKAETDVPIRAHLIPYSDTLFVNDESIMLFKEGDQYDSPVGPKVYIVVHTFGRDSVTLKAYDYNEKFIGNYTSRPLGAIELFTPALGTIKAEAYNRRHIAFERYKFKIAKKFGYTMDEIDSFYMSYTIDRMEEMFDTYQTK